MSKFNINDLTLGELKEIAALINNPTQSISNNHPMIGKHCVVRTYSAGVHIGTVKAVDGMEVLLTNAFRLWYWEGAFTLSAVANDGVNNKSRRSQEVEEIYLTQAVEFIPTTESARKNYAKLEIKNS